MRILQKIIVSLLVVSITVVLTHGVVSAEKNIKIEINGVEKTFAQMPFIESNTTLVPMRGIFESLGATVNWDGATETIVAKTTNTTVKLTLKQQFANVNGKVIPVSVPAKIVNGSTVVPLRFVSEALGAEVGWDGATRIISIQLKAETETSATSTISTASILSELEAIIGAEFLEESSTYDISEDLVEVDEDTILSNYDIKGEIIQNKIVEHVDTELVNLQNNVKLQQNLWTMFKMMIPGSNRANIATFGFYTDGPDNTLAYVEQTEEDPTKWSVFIDIQDGINLSSIFATVVHEYAHILSLSADQVEVNEDVYFNRDEDLIDELKSQCASLYLDEGCSYESSYINQFHVAFWADIQADWEAEVDEDNGDSVTDFYEQRSDQFVNDYAATSVAEDFAETFAYFVLKEKPNGNSIMEKKILFFYQFPELVQLREDIIFGLKRYMN